jgi:hypothetical protein
LISLSNSSHVLVFLLPFHSLISFSLPPLLWARVRRTLGTLLAERGTVTGRLLRWYHRQCTTAAAARYLTAATRVSLHSQLADYFLGRWVGVPKPFTHSPRQVKLQRLAETGGESDRLVAP